ncbi:hypothetical protein I7I53_08449 [Histoplasma capsulatum var. duboisii H88]|uniref:Uncharacterized protein n=1 Tax=Ajellomyces capsulatus (strain H88) TaxID=544711 RepID=A0A8A1LFR9_AJEC8|nr:hypothetical protein I7I53_08449 [Histoplasma capsulatum var. duboisii H88]
MPGQLGMEPSLSSSPGSLYWDYVAQHTGGGYLSLQRKGRAVTSIMLSWFCMDGRSYTKVLILCNP